jgi:hypothetical protein
MWMEKMRMHFEARWVQSARMRNIWQDSQPVPYTIRRTITFMPQGILPMRRWPLVIVDAK